MSIASFRVLSEGARAFLRDERGRRWVPEMPSREEAEEFMARNAVRWESDDLFDVTMTRPHESRRLIPRGDSSP